MDPLHKVVYIYAKNLLSQCNRLPTLLNRASRIQDLINSYRLLSSKEKVLVVLSKEATEEELKLFHSTSYIDFLKKCNDSKEYELEHFDEEQLEYGLGYDCPLLENCYDLVKTLAGGSLTAAKLLATRKCNIAINWFGGWHHAQRDSAEGFCYVNDIVIAIQKLTETFDKILYLDLDIHHGDGVQNAFEFSNKVLTLSFHKYMPGFYPGTGRLDDIGSSKGMYYSINVPLLEGISHDTYLELFNKIYPKVFSSFKPKAMIVQCGADGIFGDPIGESNLTLETIAECVKILLNANIPTLFLGGGGYNFANTARLWAYLTSIITDQKMQEDIPDTCEFFTEYGPTYELQIDKGFQKDCNKKEYISEVISTIFTYCEKIS